MVVVTGIAGCAGGASNGRNEGGVGGTTTDSASSRGTGGNGGSAGRNVSSGGTNATGGATGAAALDASSHVPCFSDYPWSVPGSGPGNPSLFDGGTFGCHREMNYAPPDWLQSYSAPFCPGTSSGCTYEPSVLPCGECTQQPSGYVCRVNVWAPCNCGHGPFLDQYADVWFCKCETGRWDCRDVDRSGASCQICSDAGPG